VVKKERGGGVRPGKSANTKKTLNPKQGKKTDKCKQQSGAKKKKSKEKKNGSVLEPGRGGGGTWQGTVVRTTKKEKGKKGRPSGVDATEGNSEITH